MKTLLEVREKLRQIYGTYSMYIDKAWQFLLAFGTFWSISHSMGFFKQLGNPVIILGLSVICMFLPINITVLVGSVLILANLYRLSLEIMAVTAAIMLVMYILYFRFVPKQAVIVLMIPILFGLKIPYVMPIILGLTASPLSIVASCCGIVIYYTIHSVNTYAATLSVASDDSALSRVSYFIKNVFQNKEMYLMLIAFALVIVVVYVIRRLSVNYCWQIAIGAGLVVNILAALVGSIVFDISVDYTMLIVGGILSLLAAVVLQFFLFTVDYSKTRQVQYEDDEYYYYVKAVPKVRVIPQQKQVKTFDHWKKGEKKQEPEVQDS